MLTQAGIVWAIDRLATASNIIVGKMTVGISRGGQATGLSPIARLQHCRHRGHSTSHKFLNLAAFLYLSSSTFLKSL
jgi:hypothetical protein